MLTALVLVCSASTVERSLDTCYSVMNNMLSESYNECILTIKNGIDQRMFDYEDENTGEIWKPVDFQCVNWNDVKV